MISLQLIQSITMGLTCGLIVLVFMSLLNMRKMNRLNKKREEMLFNLNTLLRRKIALVDELIHEMRYELDNIKAQRMENDFSGAQGIVAKFDSLENLGPVSFGDHKEKKEIFYNHDEIQLSQFFNREMCVQVQGRPRFLWNLSQWCGKHNWKKLEKFFFGKYLQASKPKSISQT